MNNLFINNKILNTTLSFMLAGTISTTSGYLLKPVDNTTNNNEATFMSENIFNYNSNIDTDYFFGNLEENNTILLSELTEEEKVDYICSIYGLTLKEYNTIKGIVLAEAKYDSLEDAASVCSTILNRANSKSWSGNGYNLYEEATRSGQFVVYASGAYKYFVDTCEGEAYRGFQTVLLRGIPYTYYLNFCSEGNNKIVSGGNNYYNVFKEDNYIDDAIIDKKEYFNTNKENYFDLSDTAIVYEPIDTSVNMFIKK